MRLPDCPGNHFLVWATTIYKRIARLGKFKLKVSLHQSKYTQATNNFKKNQKLWPNWLETINRLHDQYNLPF